MSSNSSNNSSDDEGSGESSIGYDEDSSEEELGDFLSEDDRELLTAVNRNDSAGVQHALKNGANVNRNRAGIHYGSPLFNACNLGYDEIVRILLDAGADIRWRNKGNWSSLLTACSNGRLSIVEMLLNHDKDLLNNGGRYGETPLKAAIEYRRTGIVHFLLDRGANALAITKRDGLTTLMLACDNGADLEILRRLLATGVPVEAGDKHQQTVLHHAALHGSIELLRELTVEHNANMFAVDKDGDTPFDLVPSFNSAGERHEFFIELYCNKLIQEHDRLALHAIVGAADYSFAPSVYQEFHPPKNPLRIRLPLGKLTLQYFRTLLSTPDAELVRNRDENGKLPIHIAGQANAPVEVLSMLVEMDLATLQIADDEGALPIHSLCGSGTPAEYASVRYLVEQGGVGTLAARNRNGALPLHVLCGSTNPSLRTVQYLIQSFPGSLAARTNAGRYPFMIAASEASLASLSVVYALVRANPSVL